VPAPEAFVKEIGGRVAERLERIRQVAGWTDGAGHVMSGRADAPRQTGRLLVQFAAALLQAEGLELQACPAELFVSTRSLPASK